MHHFMRNDKKIDMRIQTAKHTNKSTYNMKKVSSIKQNLTKIDFSDDLAPKHFTSNLINNSIPNSPRIPVVIE